LPSSGLELRVATTSTQPKTKLNLVERGWKLHRGAAELPLPGTRGLASGVLRQIKIYYELEQGNQLLGPAYVGSADCTYNGELGVFR
jgi:hypothetical protein